MNFEKYPFLTFLIHFNYWLLYLFWMTLSIQSLGHLTSSMLWNYPPTEWRGTRCSFQRDGVGNLWNYVFMPFMISMPESVNPNRSIQTPDRSCAHWLWW